ncbi:hypothetical protein AB4571_18625 [Vibrio breoganii]|uniref:hypothetical protein n=1 Tax=Vibrio breoganii TaxID=553239 RepID=UPI000C819870|nr:hypothetical protein [Vibrio breoganii]PML13811.1 hypothetical protein BCT84_12525 [Vibrio breoganii]
MIGELRNWRLIPSKAKIALSLDLLCWALTVIAAITAASALFFKVKGFPEYAITLGEITAVLALGIVATVFTGLFWLYRNIHR